MSNARELAELGLEVDVDANGNVGLGIDGPESLLHLYEKGGTSGYVTLSSIFNGSEHNAGRIAWEHASGWNTSITLGTADNHSGSYRDELTIKQGKVGIGVSNPDRPVHIRSNDNAPLKIDAADGLQASIAYALNGSDKWYVGADLFATGAQDYFIYDATTSTSRMLIDGSGNLLVGKTTTSGTVDGVTTYGSGAVEIVRTSNPLLYLNQQGTDREIIKFRKNNADIGAVRAVSGGGQTDIMVGSDGTALWFGTGTSLPDSIVPASLITYGTRTDAINLGYSNSRFKDLYLSGGVYLGGTGSANYLSDYEEGYWTPTSPDGTMQATNGGGNRYTKIGNVVYCEMDTRFFTSTSGSSTRIRGLPFTPLIYGTGNVGWSEFGVPTDIHIGSSDIYIMDNDASRHLTYAQASGKRLIASFMYTTNS